jgi:uncharacterized membrane protein
MSDTTLQAGPLSQALGIVARVRTARHRWTILLVAIAAIYCVAFSWISTQRYAAFDSSLDLGSNLALLESAISGWQPAWIVITHEGAFFSYAFVPILWASPSANTILVAQTLVIASAVFPLYFFAEAKLRNGAVAFLIAASYLICPSVQALNWFDIHPEILGMPFIFAFFYFMDRRSYWFAGFFCFLALSVSSLVALGLLGWLAADAALSIRSWRLNPGRWRIERSWHQLRLGLFVFAFAFVIATELLVGRLTQGIGVVTGAAGVNLTYPGVGNSTLAVLFAPILHPEAFASNLTFELNLKVLYFVLMFGLFLFLPLFDFRALVGTLPWLYLSFSSTNAPLYTMPYFQYSALLIPFLYFGFVNRVTANGVRFLEDWGLVWLSVVLLVPFAITPPYGDLAFDSYVPLLLVIPVVLLLSIVVRPRFRAELLPRLWALLHRPGATRVPTAVSAQLGDNRLGPWLRDLGTDSLGLTTPSHRSTGRRRWATVALFLAAVVFLFSLWTPYGILSDQYANAYVKPVVTPHDQEFGEFANLLPVNASILAQDHLYAHLWNYRYVNVHPTVGVDSDYIFADVGPPGSYEADYYEPIVTPFPALSQIVFQNLSRGTYGVLAEGDGYFILEHDFSGPTELFSPFQASIDPCSLDTFASANMTCADGHLVQTSNPSGTATAWYGPYDTLPPGTFSVTFQLQVSRIPTTSPITLGVYSFLPGPSPISQTLASEAINASAFSAPLTPTNLTLNFTVPYPALIQFTGDYVPATVLVELQSLMCRQIGTQSA